MSSFSWFDYLYRDAGNWKTFRSVLLSGAAGPEDEATIRRTLEWGDTFVPEQVGLPALQAEHLAEHGVEDGDGDDLDHAFHEFAGIRAASEEEAGIDPQAIPLATLVRRFEAAGRSGWDVTRSPFGR